MYKQNNDFHSAHIKMGINERQAEIHGCTIIPNPAMEGQNHCDCKDRHFMELYNLLLLLHIILLLHFIYRFPFLQAGLGQGTLLK